MLLQKKEIKYDWRENTRHEAHINRHHTCCKISIITEGHSS
uniref:Uncharacterized protein n=1 Tax=Rhizophora mucronata TaxID=61149 RepID=A0A2P2NUN6_RHIMU